MTNIFRHIHKSNRESVGHANLNFPDRVRKSTQIIERVANLDDSHLLNSPATHILDLGCGGGILAHVLATKFPTARVFAADLVDQRLENVKYASTFLTSKPDGKIDFPDAQFDVIICHMVLEHINPKFQGGILQECLRLLKVEGLALISFPNRWALLESHYMLPFLSWVPRRFADIYLHFFNPEMKSYDCFPISKKTFVSISKSLQSKTLKFDIREVSHLAILQELNVKNLQMVFGKKLNFLPFIPSRSYLIRRVKE